MKGLITVLALAVTAFAQDLVPRWAHDTTTLTTFLTTTYCPVTTTHVQVGVKFTLL